MRVLAIETSTLAGGVALLEHGRVVGEYALDVRVTHSERLMPAIDRLFVDAGWEPSTLGGLAVSVGPGSFTGLRIGISTAKGLALALDVPVAAVPTLDALAFRLPFAAAPVCPVLAARRDEVYASLYRWSEGAMRREWEYLALPPAELAARLPADAILLGDGAALVPAPGARRAPASVSAPAAAAVGELGLARLRAGDVVDAGALVPLYLRPPEAELRRRAGAVH
ncbi:MAG: tRNA (adenosine(37)-N6)-threonylcarbamoyltransferase complex dimerization subunit type 1 TsaB [Candidatus Rokubacteria bacterium]|nr:tRNA (adenosine(37)-N6)-threonylcarbamoyltransferase complex dimerization subunit type 1 TsaB [Candidatus Rokubacteria bacterium]MBI3827240.1 tRNA (adenosine(37)-N6)-threonylcarbamoyltransferase complex dimerization subunit type 1 TsaB [Candidatus Rokubacteria bacterium]